MFLAGTAFICGSFLPRVEEHRRAAELEKQANYREGEEIRRLTRLNEWEMGKLAKLKQDEKQEIMRAHLVSRLQKTTTVHYI